MRRSAFTLIELIVVVGILVGIAGVALLSLSDFRRESELRAVADRLEAVGALARGEALRHGRAVELLIREPDAKASGGAVRVMTRTLDPVRRAGSDRDAAEEMPAARPRTEFPAWLRVEHEEGAAVGGDRRLAVFLPDGSAVGAGMEGGVALRDSRDGARLTIRVDALTGACEAAINLNPDDADEAGAGRGS